MIVSTIYMYSLLFFCIDSSFFFLCEQQPIYLLLAYIMIMLFYPISWVQLSIMLLLSALESFLYVNIFGLSLLYLVPLVLLIKPLKKMLYMSRIYPIIATAACLTIQVFGIEWLLLGVQIPPYYTICKILVH